MNQILFFLYLFHFCLKDLSICSSEMLRSPSINVWSLIYNLSFTNISFMNIMPLHLEDSYLELRCPPFGCSFAEYEVSLVDYLKLKVYLLDTRMATPACFMIKTCLLTYELTNRPDSVYEILNTFSYMRNLDLNILVLVCVCMCVRVRNWNERRTMGGRQKEEILSQRTTLDSRGCLRL